MPIVPALIALAQFAPSLMRYFGVGGETSAKVVGAIADVATTVSGASTIDEAITVFASNPEKAYEFKLRAISMDKEFEQMYISDMQDARSRDKEFVKMGMTNTRANLMFFLALFVICVAVWMIWRDPDINEYLKGIMTLVIGRFLGYLDNIYAFEFGTTRASKEKDDTISNLSK